MPDLERGPDPPASINKRTSKSPHSGSHTSLQAGIGPALSSPVSSDSSSIIGSEPGSQSPEQWGPQHPCYPHLNPHVPISSPLYRSTRIIRIRRDWMMEGDLAPTFSNLYPEILDPAGVSEQEFRRLVESVNRELIPAFDPWSLRNIVDGVLGLLTGWLWEDLGWTSAKSRLANVEVLLEQWNRDMQCKDKEKEKDGLDKGVVPRALPLRRTGYMNLDIQVPDPEISYPTNTAEERKSVAPPR